MSILTEIENAVDTLPRAQKQELYWHLAMTLGEAPVVQSKPDRKNWLSKLSALRNRGQYGVVGVSMQTAVADFYRAFQKGFLYLTMPVSWLDV